MDKKYLSTSLYENEEIAKLAEIIVNIIILFQNSIIIYQKNTLKKSFS